MLKFANIQKFIDFIGAKGIFAKQSNDSYKLSVQDSAVKTAVEVVSDLYAGAETDSTSVTARTKNVTTAAASTTWTPAVSGAYIITAGLSGHVAFGSGTISFKQNGIAVPAMHGSAPTTAVGSYVAALIGGAAVTIALAGSTDGDVSVRFDRLVG